MKTTLSILLLVGLFLAGILLPDPVESQNCNCSPQECCSQFSYCGTTKDYCGEGCQHGPCLLTDPNNNVDVSRIVTNAFFNGIVSNSASNCPGRGFYTRDVFLRVIGDYPSFGRSGSMEDSKREIAAFFAHVTDQTDNFCHIEAINGRSNAYCDTNYTNEYPCVPNKHYYGRGPLQITWNNNYGAAGNSLGFDGLANPDIVANDSMISFKTSLWFWMKYVHSVVGQGFGATIRAINGNSECMNGENGDTVRSSVTYYTDYCKQFGVSTGGNLQCNTEPIELPIYNNLVLKKFGLYLK